MNIVITGSQGLSNSLGKLLAENHNVFYAGRNNGYDIVNVAQWAEKFYNYDVCINCAYYKWSQCDVLEQFYNMWKDDSGKQIINIGSSIVDYSRLESAKEHEYLDYKIHKQALQLTFHKLVKLANCDIKLINPGAIESDRIKHINTNKMNVVFLAERILTIMQEPAYRKVDLWL
jgi:hypothetical protein